MNDRVEKLLQPVSPDQPCGPDLTNDPRLDRLETILRGKPEVEIGPMKRPAEPPDWGTLLKESGKFLEASKHLRVAVMFACSALKVEGLPGFRDGVQLVRGMIEHYWDAVHPQLDPDDDNDPQQRLSIISALTMPRNSVPGWLQVVDYLCTAPLCRPAGVPPITLDDLLAAAGGGSADRDAATLEAQLATVPKEELDATHATVVEALKAAQGIDAALGLTLGARETIGFEDLLSTLRQIEKALAGRRSDEPPGVEAAGEGTPSGSVETPVLDAPGISGVVRSRADVIRAIDSICDYYRQAEPGSPVPYFLRRAQTLAGMSFVAAMQEMNLATPDQLRVLMGSSVDADPSMPPA